ncbi:putative ribosome biogenesis protein C8F11.04 [Andrographis paniculata]|uniref:putative ribosome biogenesis protein C8F11.04 n=1 Tax=Andrographis paniculata TaxID=175694 RepID=UPI0021E8BCB1|nr:putative ribosome biogenesis protein C8F11.04 [Andrographis paniculata]
MASSVTVPDGGGKSSAMATTSRDGLEEASVRKAANALLKWKTKVQKQPHNESGHEESEDEERDDFVYLSITLKRVPPTELTRVPHRIPLRHSIFPEDHSILNVCLIVDGKRITAEVANRTLKSQGVNVVKQVMKLSKLKSDYKSFESKKKLYDSFDLFVAANRVVPMLPMVLGKVFYNKKKKLPVPVDLKLDGSKWKEEIELACKSSLWCLSGGTCSAVRVGRFGVTEGNQIVENVFEAIDEVVKIVPKRWKGIKCLHLRFSDSVALPIYDCSQALQQLNGDEVAQAEGDDSGLVGKKRKREVVGKKQVTK